MPLASVGVGVRVSVGGRGVEVLVGIGVSVAGGRVMIGRAVVDELHPTKTNIQRMNQTTIFLFTMHHPYEIVDEILAFCIQLGNGAFVGAFGK